MPSPFPPPGGSRSLVPRPGRGHGRFFLARTLSNGALDGTFGSGGQTQADIGGPGNAEIRAIALHGAGLIAVGNATVGGEPRLAVAR